MSQIIKNIIQEEATHNSEIAKTEEHHQFSLGCVCMYTTKHSEL